jgi:hypothetical protein
MEKHMKPSVPSPGIERRVVLSTLAALAPLPAL